MVLGNPVYEPGRTFSVVLSNPQNAVLGNQGGNGTIFDDAPIAHIGPSTTVNEGSTVQFDASSSQSLDGDPLTFTWNFGDGTTGTGAQPTHVYTDEGVYTATVSVSDGSAVSTATETVTVLSLPPTVTYSGPADAVPGQPRTYTFAAADVSPVDQAAGFSYQITWGDGSTQTIQGGSSVSVTHVFAVTGSYGVTAAATDQDGNTGSAGQTIRVVTAELQGGDLYVGGTTGGDTITVQPADTNGTVDVVVNGQDQGTFVPTGQVVVYGQGGNDVIQVAALNANGVTKPLALPVVMIAGNGNDTLDARGASGPTVLVGGGDNDILYGGSGRNILIAGTGASALYAGSADDLLIAGSTSFDANLAALVALRNEWARTDADYLTRIADLTGSQSGGLNGGYLLNAQTVKSSGVGDSLYGGAGLDWFFAATGGANPDQLYNVVAGEVVTSLG
jgi:PKD repeat protein